MKKFIVSIFFASLCVFAIPAKADFTVCDTKFTVKPRAYVYYTFLTNNDATVTGRFEAEGGDGNDIECFIVDEDGFKNYSNGHAVRTWYNSGRITVANIYTRVPKGRYFIIFNNNFSWLANKVVTAKIRVNN